MKRRRFFQTLAVAGTVPALSGQQQQTALPKLETSTADSAAETLPHFFSTAQFAALRRLSDMLQPALNGAPGALDAKAAEFLDFLIGESPADRQQLYRDGLDALHQAGFTDA